MSILYVKELQLSDCSPEVPPNQKMSGDLVPSTLISLAGASFIVSLALRHVNAVASNYRGWTKVVPDSSEPQTSEGWKPGNGHTQGATRFGTPSSFIVAPMLAYQQHCTECISLLQHMFEASLAVL